MGLAIPAQVSETPILVSPEAEDAVNPGGGSSEDIAEALRSITIGEEDTPEDLFDKYESDEESILHFLSSDEDELP
jgi:hypothetical protein